MRGRKNKWILYFGFRNDTDGRLILGFFIQEIGWKYVKTQNWDAGPTTKNTLISRVLLLIQPRALKSTESNRPIQ
jgi:hypothetical protein